MPFHKPFTWLNAIIAIALLASCAPKKDGIGSLKNSLDSAKEKHTSAATFLLENPSPENTLDLLKTSAQYHGYVDALTSKNSPKGIDLFAIENIANEEFIKAGNRSSNLARNYQTLSIKPLAVGGKGTINGNLICSRSTDTERGCPSVENLPVTISNVLKMSAGDFVILPFNGTFTIPIDNKSIGRLSYTNADMSELLHIEAKKYVSSSMAGQLIIKGSIAAAVVRTREGARVIWTLGKNLEIGQTFRGSVSQVTKAVFLPVSYIETINQLRLIKNISNTSDLYRLTNNLSSLSSKTKEIAQSIKTKEDEVNENKFIQTISNIRNFSGNNLEKLSNFVKRSSGSIENLISRHQNAIDTIAGNANKLIISPYNYAIKNLKKYSSKAFSFSGAVDFTGTLSKNIAFVKDYTFNLGSDSGRDAFKYAVSGLSRTVIEPKFEDTFLSLTETKPEDNQYDLTIAENLSLDDNSSFKAVKINHASLANSIKNRYAFNLTFLGAKHSYESIDTKTKITAFNPGDEKLYNFEVSTNIFKENNSTYLTNNRNEQTSYLLAESNSDASMLYYGFDFEFSKYAIEKNKKSILKIANVLGPMSKDIGLYNLYVGDTDDIKGFTASIGIKGTALNRILDKTITTLPLMWEAFERVAISFNNEFGLPFLDLGIFAGTNKYSDFSLNASSYNETSSFSSLSQYISEKCGTVRKTLGNQWCRWFADVFSYDLLKTQYSNPKQIDLLDFLYQQSTKKYLVNTIKRDFIFRLVNEMVYLGLNSQRHNIEDYYYLYFKIHGNENTPLPFVPEKAMGDLDYYNLFQTYN